MNLTTICIDAGLVIQLVAFPDLRAVQELWDRWEQEQLNICAPSLLPYEVTNVLYRYGRQGWLSGETVAAALLAALTLPIELVEDAQLHIRARALAEQYELPAAYDAHYLALAERIGADLWTADKKLINSLQKYNIPWLRQVSD